MLLASKLAVEHKWQVIQQLPHPLLSPALAKVQNKYSETTSLLLESSNCRCKLELLFHWNELNVSASTLKATPPGGSDVQEKWENRIVLMHELTGQNIREKFVSLFSNP